MANQFCILENKTSIESLGYSSQNYLGGVEY